MSDTLQRDIGRHDEAIETLKEDMTALRKDVADIKEILATNKGGIRMLFAVGSIGASMGAGIAEIIHWWYR